MWQQRAGWWLIGCGLVVGVLAVWVAPLRSQVNGTDAFLPIVARPDELCFQAQAGAVIVEVESHPAVEEWAVETAVPGYTGSAYYTWRGPDLFASPGAGVMAYIIEIDTPGEYQLRLHNLHVHPDSTLANDVFTRMDQTTWIKTFSPVRGEWTWATWFEFANHSQDSTPGHFLNAGRHLFEFSARSADFSLDRFVLYLEGVDVLDPALPPSPACD